MLKEDDPSVRRTPAKPASWARRWTQRLWGIRRGIWTHQAQDKERETDRERKISIPSVIWLREADSPDNFSAELGAKVSQDLLGGKAKQLERMERGRLQSSSRLSVFAIISLLRAATRWGMKPFFFFFFYLKPHLSARSRVEQGTKLKRETCFLYFPTEKLCLQENIKLLLNSTVILWHGYTSYDEGKNII